MSPHFWAVRFGLVRVSVQHDIQQTSFTVLFAARFCKAAKGRKLSINERGCSGWAPALKAAAVYAPDPASQEGGGRTRPAACPFLPLGQGAVAQARGHSPHSGSCPLCLPTCLCDSSPPRPALPACYFSAWLCLSVCLSPGICRCPVPTCLPARAPAFACLL